MMPVEAVSPTCGVVAGTPAAADAGAAIFRAGGNAVDAGIAACLALCVTDPPNLSLAGRCHALVGDSAGNIDVIDGASEVPTQSGAAGPIPIPGLPAALAMLHHRHGRLPQMTLFEPAIRAAENGFVVSDEVQRVWSRRAPELAADPGCHQHYLFDGKPPNIGEQVRIPALAAFLLDLQERGFRSFYQHPSVIEGGPWSRQDLDAYRAQSGAQTTLALGNNRLVTVGRQGWGPVLTELLRALVEIDVGLEEVGELDAIARACAGVLDRRLTPTNVAAPDQDTTHLASVDGSGLMLSLTASIGPHFGSRKAHPTAGFLFAHSYQMAAGKITARRDVTEMCPSLILRDDKPWLAIGAAGSERTPLAIAQVLRHRLQRHSPLPDAVSGPRLSAAHHHLRLWRDAPPSILKKLRQLGWRVERAGPGHINHVGIVHALERQPDGQIVGAADEAYDGAIRIVRSTTR